MRRLFLLALFGLALIGAAVPMRAAPMAAMPHAHVTGQPHPCGGDHMAACAHACLGCALAPADPATLSAGQPRAGAAPIAGVAFALRSARIGLDPPPPRRG